MRTSTVLGLGVVVLASGGVLYARRDVSSRRAAGAKAELAAAQARGDLILHVPHASGAITLDGDTDDPGWLRPPGPVRTGNFVLENGRPAVPHSSARIVWAGEYLYLALYAADEDIESHVDRPDGPIAEEDAFRVLFSAPRVEYAIDVSPNAVITDSIRRGGGDWDLQWNSGAHASRELDGTVNDTKNKDEEWSIELAVPFESLGMRGEPGENIGMSLRRCDVSKGVPRVCGGWGEGADEGGKGRIVLE
jgi:hypothetical protein